MNKKLWKLAAAMMMVILLAGAMGLLAGCGSGDESSRTEDETAAAETESTEIGEEDAPEAALSFETRDLEGNVVDSAELFSENKVTMINLWGTFCPPCIKEMPDLEEINNSYSEKGAEIVGVVIDVPADDDGLLGEAEKIVEETGVTYRSLRAWDGLESAFPTSVVPTTFFVDSRGRILGEPVYGAMIEEYKSRLDQYLAEAE